MKKFQKKRFIPKKIALSRKLAWKMQNLGNRTNAHEILKGAPKSRPGPGGALRPIGKKLAR